MSMAQKLFEVVGGGDKGGIVVREAALLSSPELPRLATGSIVEELESTPAGRLRYRLLRGSGPQTGWVSLKLKEKALLTPCTEASGLAAADDAPSTSGGAEASSTSASSAAATAAAAAQTPASSSSSSSRPRPPPVAGRRIKVLCLHGTAGSPGVLKQQLAMLIRACSDEAEFVFHGGHLECTKDDPVIGKQVELVQPYFPREVLTQYALPVRGHKGTDGDPADPDTWRSYDGLEEAMERVQASLVQHQPVDVVLGFSQGANLASVAAAQASRGQGPPLHCVVHLCTSLPGWTRHGPFQSLFQEPLSVPALVVKGAKDTVATGNDQVASLYSTVERLEHSSEHRPLPREAKESQEFVQLVKSFIVRHCRG